MPPVTDTIYLSLNPSGQMIATPDSIAVTRGHRLVWKKMNPAINSFSIIPPADLFSPPVPNGNWNLLPVVIQSNAPYNTYKYSIGYIINGHAGRLDPKIAVKPSTGTIFQFVVPFILLVIIVIVYKKSRKRKQLLNEESKR